MYIEVRSRLVLAPIIANEEGYGDDQVGAINPAALSPQLLNGYCLVNQMEAWIVDNKKIYIIVNRIY